MVKSIWVLDSGVGGNINTTAPLGKRIITILNIHYRSNIVKRYFISRIGYRVSREEKELEKKKMGKQKQKQKMNLQIYSFKVSYKKLK